MGCGRVGSTLAASLDRLGHSVAVIDQDRHAFRRLAADFAGRQVTGLGFDREVLVEAGIERADAFAAVSSGDNSNIISARVARETFGIARVVARIYDAKRAAVYERLGIPTVATVPWTADRMLRMLVPDGVASAWRDPTSTVAILQLPVNEDWVGRPSASWRRPPAAGWRSSSASAPACCPRRRDVRAGRRHDLRRSGVGHRQRRHVRSGRAAAAGGLSSAGRHRGSGQRRALHRPGADRQRPPGDAHRAPAVATSTPSGRAAEWVLADACELASLEEAELATCDVVVAATGDDKVNLVVSLLAKTEFAVPRVVARVNGPRTSGCSPSTGASTSR